MRLTKASEAVQKVINPNHSILIYGPPKSGKTRLMATSAKIPEINNIHLFDGENGFATILNMGLSEAELSKFILYKVPDTRDNPRFIETVMKALTSKVPVKICDMHGMVNCPDCTKNNAPAEPFLLTDCKHNDLIVIDSGSQLGASALNAACRGKPVDYKPLHDDYGYMGKMLTDCLMIIQQCQNTNFLVITHELSTEGEDNIERIYPLMGTKNFSTNVAKYFGTVVYTHTKLGGHVAGSSSTYKPSLITGSRLNIALEKHKDPDMRQLLIEGGIIK